MGQGVALFGLASILLVGAIGHGALRLIEPRLVAQDVDEAQRQVLFMAERIVEPALGEGVVSGDPAAVAAFDRAVRDQVLRPGVVQVKLWAADGTILYSNVAELVGRRFELEPEQRALLEDRRGSSAEPSDLEREEHVGLPAAVPVTEIYAVIHGPGGELLLWEAYVERHSLVERAESLMMSLGVTGALAASVLLVAQVALAFVLSRQVMQGREQRIDLLQRAVTAANTERRRIASDLHDGVIQDLHGLAFDLDAVGAPGRGPPDAARPEELDLAARLRRSLRDLRTLAVDVHPPDLHSHGLRAALERLLRTCDGRLDWTLEIDDELDLDDVEREVLFRTAQEAVRNVLAHADADHLVLEVRRRRGRVHLTVTDDGRGFEHASADVSVGVSDGHLGLALVAEMVESAGGRVVLRSRPGAGTSLRAEVPG